MSENSSKTLLLDLCPEPRLPQTAYLRRAFAADRRFQYYQVTDLKQAIPVVQKAESVLIYFEVSKKEHIINLIILLSAAAKLIQKGLCKTIGFNLMAKGAEQIEAMLKQKGVTEVAAARTSEKGILHKVNRFYEGMQMLDTRRKAPSASAAASALKHAALEWIDALPIPNDYWMLQRLSDVKYRRETWMFSLIGPPPSFGKWELDRSLKSGGLDGWVWVPRKPGTAGAAGLDESGSGLRKIMSQEEGKWIFWGNPPQFSSQNYMWLFVSRNPRFAFYSRAKPKEPSLKVSFADMKLSFAKNSPAAGKFVSEIQASLTAEVRFKGSQPNRSNREIELTIEKPRRDGGSNDFAIEKDMDASGSFGEIDFGALDEAGAEGTPQVQDEEAFDFKPGEGGIADLTGEQPSPDEAAPDSLDEIGRDEAFDFSKAKHQKSESAGPDDFIDFGQDESGFQWDSKEGSGEPAADGAEGEPGFFSDSSEDASAFTFGKGKQKARVIHGGGQGGLDSRRNPSVTIKGAPGVGRTSIPGASKPGMPTGPIIESNATDAEPYEKLFQELNFRILVTPVLSVAGQAQSFSAKFLDLYETQLSLEISGASLRRGQLVMVQFIIEKAEPPLDFGTRAKVMELESSNGETMVIGFEIEPVDPKLIERFMAVFQERQQHVTEFLIAARGGR